MAQRFREPATIGAMRDNLNAFVKNSKRAEEKHIQLAAIVNLCQLHAEVVVDPRLPSSDALKGVRATAATRLRKWAQDVQLAQLRAERKKGKSQGSPSEQSMARSRFGGHQLANSPGEVLESDQVHDAVEFGYRIAGNVSGSFTGGAGQLANYTGNFGPDADQARELIALIEATLNPDFWRTNGGPGSIHYYGPGLALVVTATQEMHDRIESLLLRLR